MTQILAMKPSESKILLPVESYDEKTAENYRSIYVAKNSILGWAGILAAFCRSKTSALSP